MSACMFNCSLNAGGFLKLKCITVNCLPFKSCNTFPLIYAHLEFIILLKTMFKFSKLSAYLTTFKK